VAGRHPMVVSGRPVHPPSNRRANGFVWGLAPARMCPNAPFFFWRFFPSLGAPGPSRKPAPAPYPASAAMKSSVGYFLPFGPPCPRDHSVFVPFPLSGRKGPGPLGPTGVFFFAQLHKAVFSPGNAGATCGLLEQIGIFPEFFSRFFFFAWICTERITAGTQAGHQMRISNIPHKSRFGLPPPWGRPGG